MSLVLVTGAAGFTGRYLTKLLSARGHEVHGVVHHMPAQPVEGCRSLHVADLASRDEIARIVDHLRPQHVVHLAAVAFVGHENIEEMYRSNVVGTRQLLDALANVGSAIRSVLIASSANIYGNRREGSLDETITPSPANDYGVSKVATELVAGLYSDRLPIIVVRPFNYTGRGQAEHFLIPKIINHVKRRAPSIELGNLDVARDFSDVRSIVDAYARLLVVPEAVGQTLNVSSGRSVALGDILALVAEISGHAFDIQINEHLVRRDEVRRLSGNSDRLREVIGDLDAIPLKQTLQWMLES